MIGSARGRLGVARRGQIQNARVAQAPYQVNDAETGPADAVVAAQLASALLGELQYERGQLDEAERLLEESRQLGAESGVVDFMIASYVVLARIKVHRSAATEATELLNEGAKVAERLGLTRLYAAVMGERIRQLLLVRRVGEARPDRPIPTQRIRCGRRDRHRDRADADQFARGGHDRRRRPRRRDRVA
jgi:ATP/maltotriose-dependent transcriptional regulator MalT